MKSKFSERIGISTIPVELIKNGMSHQFSNTIWNLITEFIIEAKTNDVSRGNPNNATTFFTRLWMNHLGKRVDELPKSYGQVSIKRATNELKEWFLRQPWHAKLDLLEFLVESEKQPQLEEICNLYLKKEYSAYRFLKGNLVEISSEDEIKEVEQTLNLDGELSPVKTHMRTALKLISDRESPDYRNSIKESISAVEALCQIIVGDKTTTLGQALKVIEKKHKIPGSLKKAFSSLYGYASNETGIRHTITDETISIDQEEAHFMLISCSAFINYLNVKRN